MQTKRIRIVYMMVIFLIIGCIAAVSPLAAADVFKVDPVHSAVTFKIKHLGIAYVHGRFNNAAGSITFDEHDPAKSSVAISVKVADIDTFNAKRDAHLKSAEFFDAEKFPLISFVSDTVERTAEGIYAIAGQLSFHGVKRELTIKAEKIGTGFDPWGNFRAGFETSFTVKRSDFGMTHMLGSVGDEVLLTVSIEAIRQSPNE